MDVWQLRTDSIPLEPVLQAALSPDEQAIMAGFADAGIQSRYCKTHACLKLLLSLYLGLAPDRIEVRRNAHGKPYLPCGAPHFNMSHTGGAAVYAVSCSVPVGVDVEQTRLVPEASQIASRCFSREERSWIDGSANPERDFFRCWVCREAIGKASGYGLLHSMDPDALECLDGHLRSRENLPLHEWEPWPGFRAALACAPPYTGGPGRVDSRAH